MIASCKKYNLKLGFFYSVHFNWFLGVDGYKVRCCQLSITITLAVPLTREASTLQVGHPPLGPRNLTQDEYLTIAKAQLREIIEMFGDEGPLEVWFDVRAERSEGCACCDL